MRPLLLTAAALIAGCSTAFHDHWTYPTTGYRFGTGPEVDRSTAERTIIEGILKKQISPPLDAPLVAESIVLPIYPLPLQRANVTGKVLVNFKLGPTGEVSEARVVGTNPTPLDEVALDAIRKWKFKPPMRGGTPVELSLNYWFNFILE